VFVLQQVSQRSNILPAGDKHFPPNHKGKQVDDLIGLNLFEPEPVSGRFGNIFVLFEEKLYFLSAEQGFYYS
jgi:hypothetical protein